jgi:predicted ester cyclase
MTATRPTVISRGLMICRGGGATAALAAGLIATASRARTASAGDLDGCYNKLLDAYMDAVNAHDTGKFPAIFTDSYIQHSGRSPSGLQGQIANFVRIFENWPDFQLRFEDRIFSGEKIVARTALSATHTRPVLGFPPTRKRVTWGAIDIWRVENGMLAEHWDVVDVAALQKQLRGK